MGKSNIEPKIFRDLYSKNCFTNKFEGYDSTIIIIIITTIIILDFEIQIDHSILIRRPDRVSMNKNKKNFSISRLHVPVKYIIEIKEKEKTNKYLNLVKEQKKIRGA